MTVSDAHTQRKVQLESPATIEEVICNAKGTGHFGQLMKLAVGLAIGTDGIEVTLLSYLVPCVAVDWDLSSLQKGSLTASVFAGELVGAMVLGVVGDVYGRRPGFKIATGLVLAFGLMTVVAPSFGWLLFFRTMVGVGAGGMEVPFDLLGELVPRSEKGRILVDVQIMWAFGSLFVGVIAWAVLSNGYSWRWLALLAAVPPAAVVCCFPIVPESPRWYLVNGQPEKAENVLRTIARRNGVELGIFSLRLEEKATKQKNNHVSELWRRPELRSRSIVSWVIWTAFGFVYYGVILLSALVLDESGTCSFDYPILFFAASSEVVGNIASRMYVDQFDRRTSLTTNFFLSGAALVVLPFTTDMTLLLIMSFIARGTAYTAACFSWVITPELYPTEIRSTGHAVSNSFARMGAIGASYWVASGLSYKAVAVVILVMALAGGVAGQMWPTIVYDQDVGSGEAPESRPLLWAGDSGLAEEEEKRRELHARQPRSYPAVAGSQREFSL